MKFALDEQGGLALLVESDMDWFVLDSIVDDIKSPRHLAESLASLMDDESEWDEWVVPELVDGFDAQCDHVTSAINQARKMETPQVEITREDADLWYGALNQSRLALQDRYRFDALSPEQMESEEIQQAYLRDRFYSSIQSVLLEYVMQ